MKIPGRFLLLSLVALGFATGRAQTTAPGYKVIVDITFDEQGSAEDAKVVTSDDPSETHLLNQIALSLALKMNQPSRMKDGKPIKFQARAPFNFPVEGDEGGAANNAPKPTILSADKPEYPENMAATGTVGGSILELRIGADGKVNQTTVLRASHPEFGQAAQKAVSQWVFTPAQKDGKPVECRWRIAVNFSVNGKESDWMWRVAPRPSLGSYTVVRVKQPAAAEPAVEATK